MPAFGRPSPDNIEMRISDLSYPADSADRDLVRQWERRLKADGLPPEPDRNDVLPRSLAARVELAREKFVEEHDEEPVSIAQLLEGIGTTTPQRRRALEEYGLRVDSDHPDITEPATSDQEVIDQHFLEKAVADVLDTLREDDAEVVSMLYGLGRMRPHTLDEVAAHRGVSKTRISQIRDRALRSVRRSSRAEMLRPYYSDDTSPSSYNGVASHQQTPERRSSHGYLSFLGSMLYWHNQNGRINDHYSPLADTVSSELARLEISSSSILHLGNFLLRLAEQENTRNKNPSKDQNYAEFYHLVAGSLPKTRNK